MELATPLSLARVALGVTAWAAPRTCLRALQLDPAAPQSTFLCRLLGARDLAFGALTLLAGPDRRPALLRIGIALDAADAAAAVLATRSNAVSTRSGALQVAAAGSAVVAGVLASGRRRGH